MAPDIEYPKGCQPISTSSTNSELSRRLKELSKALENSITNEEAGCSNRYSDLLHHLTQERFLKNKNKDIQLLLACCIADIFRVFAPNSPINDPELLKKVLLFITAVIGNGTEKENTMFRYYTYLIENLSVVETMQLALELGDEAYIILRQLIKHSIGSINDKNANDHIQGMLLGMCSKLIQGVDQISNIVLDAVFYFIVFPQKLNNREAYRMARDLIRTNQTTLEPYVALLLKRGLETGVLDECDMISQKKLYDLISELYKFAPEMTSTALPLLVEQLRNEDVTARRESARLFGNLFGEQESRLAEEEPDAWSEYMKRFGDVNEEIRCICIRDAENIMVFHPELRGQVTDAIISRCEDADENVRLEVITMVQSLTKRKFEALSERLLTIVTERIRDKKVNVRHAAIRGLSHLHRAVFSNDNLTNLERSSVLSIFSAIMHHYYQPLLVDRLLTEKIFVSCLVPYKLDEGKRMSILITIFLSLDGYGMKALEQILNKQSFQRRLLGDLVKFIEQTSEPQKGKTINDVVKHIVEYSPEPAKFSIQFRQFMDHLRSDSHMLTLMKYITGKEYTCQNVESAVLEILKRLREHKASSECLEAMRSLFECCSPLQFDGSAVSVLVDKTVTMIGSTAYENPSERCHRLLKLLNMVAHAYPHCFVTEPTLDSLVQLIEMENITNVDIALSMVITISAELKANKLLAKNTIKKYVMYCERLSLDGTPRVAKYAVRCISSLLNAEQARVKLASVLQESLQHVSASDPQCCTALKALNSCIEADAAEFCEELLRLLKTKVMDLLLDRNVGTAHHFSSTVEGSHNDSELSAADTTMCDKNYVDIKKHCLKFMANFLVSVAQFTECDVELVAKNLFKLYSTLLETKGDIFKKPCSRTDMAEFRVLAGNSMLKLATKSRYFRFVTSDDLVALSTLGYDDEAEVRHSFFGKLHKYLFTLQLHIEYMGLFALTALREDKVYRERIRVLVDANITKRRKYLERSEVKSVAPYYQPEYCLAYAIYILSKLPSFESIKCEPELRRLTECIWFLLEIFSSRNEPGSLEFIYNIFKAVKNSTDAKTDGCTREETVLKNEKIWALCDIGILLLSYRVKNLMKGVDCKPLLSKRFFLSTGRANTKIYVPVSFAEEMKTKKANAKHTQADVTGTVSKISIRQRQSVSISSVSETVAGSKRNITAKSVGKVLTRGRSHAKEKDGDVVGKKMAKVAARNEKPSQEVTKWKTGSTKLAPRISSKTNTAGDGLWGLEREASFDGSSPTKDNEMLGKHRTLLKTLSSGNEPGTSKTSPNVRGSLEDCECSPIRPVNDQPPNVTKSAVAVRRLPFMSSTPIVSAKKRRVLAACSEDNEDPDNDDGGEKAKAKKIKMTPEKAEKVEIKKGNAMKGGKMKKLCAVRRVEMGMRKTQTAEMANIASRLRSRGQVAASVLAQTVSEKPMKKCTVKVKNKR